MLPAARDARFVSMTEERRDGRFVSMTEERRVARFVSMTEERRDGRFVSMTEEERRDARVLRMTHGLGRFIGIATENARRVLSSKKTMPRANRTASIEVG